MTRPEIAERWKRHLTRKFPREYAGAEVAGICVTSADTFLAGCVSYFVNSGALDPQRLDVVHRTCHDLEIALPHLTSEAREYFEELLLLGRAVAAHATH